MERICPHGVGHPDPDHVFYTKRMTDTIHGCDGCCLVPATQQTSNEGQQSKQPSTESTKDPLHASDKPPVLRHKLVDRIKAFLNSFYV
jgi:hypothetical protein